MKKSSESSKLSAKDCMEFIEAIASEKLLPPQYEYSLHESKTGAEILLLDSAKQVALVLAMMRWYFQWLDSIHQSTVVLSYDKPRKVLAAMWQLLNRQLPFTQDNVLELLASVCDERCHNWLFSINPVIKTLQNYLKDHPLTPEIEASVAQVCNYLNGQGSRYRQQTAKFRKLIQSEAQSMPIIPGEAWSDCAIQAIGTLPSPTQAAWLALLTECQLCSGGQPTAKWLKGARTHRDALEADSFKQFLLQWFPLVDAPRTQPLTWRGEMDVLHDNNADILKGLVWLCADWDDADLARTLSQVAISAYRKLPGIGPRCVKLGNACVWALGQMPTPEAIAQLALLKVKIKFGTAQKGIEKAFTAAAERTGLSREDIEELSVPTYSLTAVGLRRETLGEFTAELAVTGTSSTTLQWLKADGKPLKSTPKAIKEEYPDALKSLTQAAKDIQKMLPAQRDRIESLYLYPKTWDFTTWQERYLNHPLLGTLARRIIWQFQSSPDAKQQQSAIALWWEGQLVDVANQPIDWLMPQAQVSLWHPITASSNIIQSWRNWLLEHQIQQPFKQAHRELYLLTPAEENTRIYSNRFAAHILKQHQFNALCGQRGWKNQLRLMVDDCYAPARLLLPQWGLRAEFWIEAIGDAYGIDTNESGTYLYLSTDQVRFYPVEAAVNSAHAAGGGYGPDHGEGSADPIPLTEIPALVFSEVMRDVDLFVGVASVGNDPNWVDGGPEGRHVDYWHSYSFGELSATAALRRQVLEILLPKLKKIRDRCSLQERFLVVQGDIRTYKIHLGSGNILMEPNDQYLCIVQGSGKSASDQVFLPFEGDKTLAIILSKAFLLADDLHITDPTILTQLRL